MKEFFDFCREHGYPVDKVHLKEKYGGIRLEPFEGGDDKLRDKIIEIENISHETCMECGEPGTDRDTGWIVTLCDKCFKDLYPNKQKCEN